MNEVFQAIRSVDLRIYNFFGHFAGNRLFDHLARFEEGNNLFKGGLYFAMYWYLWSRIGSDRDKRRKAIIAIVIGTTLAIIIARTIAFVVPFRVRPIYDPTLAHPSYSIPMTPNLENWSAFPSDTAAYFFALAFGLAYLLRSLAIQILLYTTVWTCLPRMYLGLHYASDMVVGIAIGIATVWLSIRSDSLESIITQPALTAMETRPQWFYTVAFLLSFEMATVFDGLRNAGNAVFHGALIALHLGYTHSSHSRPIDVWGGLLAMVGFLVIAGYVVHVLYRKFHSVREAKRPP
jgi:membrane-associated phospholipid phosphatase